MQPKTVLITGCSTGIGRATAELFLAEGWRVYATARNEEDIDDLADHAECRTLELDVTLDRECKRAVNRVLQESDRIDCLVNNAGFGQFGPIEDVPVEKVHRQFDVNVYGPHRLTRRVLPHMREQGQGTIVNVSSIVGRISLPMTGVYSGSKHALEAMTDALRSEIDGYGLDAVLVEPGPVETSFTERASAEVGGDREEDDVGGVERSGAYESFYALFEDTEAIGGGGPGAVSAGQVAEVIVEAASSPNPDPRYPVGPIARYGALARFIPDRFRDRLFDLIEKHMT